MRGCWSGRVVQYRRGRINDAPEGPWTHKWTPCGSRRSNDVIAHVSPYSHDHSKDEVLLYLEPAPLRGRDKPIPSRSCVGQSRALNTKPLELPRPGGQLSTWRTICSEQSIRHPRYRILGSHFISPNHAVQAWVGFWCTGYRWRKSCLRGPTILHLSSHSGSRSS